MTPGRFTSLLITYSLYFQSNRRGIDLSTTTKMWLNHLIAEKLSKSKSLELGANNPI
jgi:hypothetical protein